MNSLFSVLRKQLVAGLTSGCVGQFVSSPADLIKVQMQIEGLRRRQNLPPRFVRFVWSETLLFRGSQARGMH